MESTVDVYQACDVEEGGLVAGGGVTCAFDVGPLCPVAWHVERRVGDVVLLEGDGVLLEGDGVQDRTDTAYRVQMEAFLVVQPSLHEVCVVDALGHVDSMVALEWPFELRQVLVKTQGGRVVVEQN